MYIIVFAHFQPPVTCEMDAHAAEMSPAGLARSAVPETERKQEG